MKLDPVRLFTYTARLYIDNIRIYEVTNMLPILTDVTHINRWETFVRPLIANASGQYVHVNVHVCSGNPHLTRNIVIKGEALSKLVGFV